MTKERIVLFHTVDVKSHFDVLKEFDPVEKN